MKRKWQNPIVELWREYSWSALGVLALLALTLGYIGFDQQSEARQIGRGPADNLYLALLLFSLNPVEGPHVGPFLEVARFVAIVVASIAIFKTLKIIFDEQYQALKLSHVKDHIVICGLGQKGSLLAESLRQSEPETRLVVIEKADKENFYETCREMGVLPCVGDASQESTLKKVRVSRARCVIAVCADDSTNASIAATVRTVLEKEKHAPAKPLTCVVHLVDDNLRDLLEANLPAQEQRGSCRLEFFNVYDSGARALMLEFPPVVKRGDTNETVPVVVLGADWLARNVTEAICAQSNTSELPVRVIGPQASSRIEGWCIDEKQKSQLQGIDAAKEEFTHQTWLAYLPSRVGAAYICLENDNLTLGAALQLRHQHPTAEIVACLQNQSGLASLLNTDNDKALQTFALLSATCNAQLPYGGTNERIAKAIHDYFSPCEPSSWADAEPQNQESSRRAANYIGVMLGAIGCRIVPSSSMENEFEFEADEIKKLAEMEHSRWQSQEKQSWTYGETKNNEKKIHPDCQEWNALSEGSRENNRQYIRSLTQILCNAGYKISRNQKGSA